MNLRFICAMSLLPLFAFAASGAQKTVALVFDDGPAAQQTPRLLELLHTEGVTVTFSYLGREVEKHPGLALAAARAGHEINNHSYTHPHLRVLDDAAVSSEVSRTSAAIERATGHPPVWFWSPFLETDERIDRLAKAAGLVHFPWLNYHFISTDDWDEQHTAPATIRHNATTGVTDGTIILFHEWREATLEQLPGILVELRRQGCVFVTLSGFQVRFGDKAPAVKK
jgi:peptidoglycan/xylan/chitin deacetylase (PgdA/CDA1 family)